ncbi:MAG: hypothetical protein IJU48_04655 [Synergistaceae bacterium]|nr:hypothetical protein [Synergistaceae bacterium]
MRKSYVDNRIWSGENCGRKSTVIIASNHEKIAGENFTVMIVYRLGQEKISIVKI